MTIRELLKMLNDLGPTALDKEIYVDISGGYGDSDQPNALAEVTMSCEDPTVTGYILVHEIDPMIDVIKCH